VPLTAPNSEFFACTELHFAAGHSVSEKAKGAAGLILTPLTIFSSRKAARAQTEN